MATPSTWIRIVRESGDETGVTDYTNIMAAYNEFIADAPSGNGTVVLYGKQFYVNQPIIFGSLSLMYPNPGYCFVPSLIGVNNAAIKYTGSGLLVGPLISIIGNTGEASVRLANLYLDGGWWTRGILISRQTYHHIVENIVMDYVQGVGVDYVDSWKGILRNIHLHSHRGIGLRVRSCSAAVIENVRIASSVDSYWPDVDDETVETYQAGVYVQTPVAMRAAVVLTKCFDLSFYDFCFESNALGSKPLVSIDSTSTGGIYWDGSTWTENDNTSDCHILIDGGSGNFCYNYTFNNWNIDTISASGYTNSVVKTIGNVAGLRMDCVKGGRQTPIYSVVNVTSGNLLDCELSRIRIAGSGSVALGSEDWIHIGTSGNFIDGRAIGYGGAEYEVY